MLPDFELDDIVRMRKGHPCGGYTWRIVRLGADIGLECLNCKRRVMLSRRELAQRMKSLQHGACTDQEPPASSPPTGNHDREH